MHPAKRVAVNTGILYAKMAVTVFISLYVTRLVLAALGAEDFGIYNVLLGSIAMLTFLNAAMVTTSLRFMSYAHGEGNDERQKSIFNISSIIHLIIAIVVVLILEVAGYLLFKFVLDIPQDRIIIARFLYQFMLVSTFFTMISVPYDAVINAHENMLLFAILGIIDTLLKLAFAIYITYTVSDKLLIYGVLMTTIPILSLILKAIYCHKKYEEVQFGLKKYFDKPLFKEMTNFASLSLLNSAASIITTQGIAIILNSFFGVIVNAAQGVTNQITGQLMAFSTTMLKALNPVIVKSEGGNNREQMIKASTTGNKLSFFLMSFFAVPVIIDMPFIFDLWLKEVPEYAVIFCRLNLIKFMFNQLAATFPTAIEATGKIKQYSYWNSFFYFLALPVSYLCFKLGAPPPTIYIILIIMMLALISVRLYFANRTFGLSVNNYFRVVVIPCFSSLLLNVFFTSIPLFLMQPGLVRLVIILAVNFVSFSIFMYFIGLQNDEKLFIIKSIKYLYTKFNNRKVN